MGDKQERMKTWFRNLEKEQSERFKEKEEQAKDEVERVTKYLEETKQTPSFMGRSLRRMGQSFKRPLYQVTDADLQRLRVQRMAEESRRERHAKRRPSAE